MKQPLLTNEEQLQLIAAYKAGDNSAREKLIKANLRLSVKLAYKYAGYSGWRRPDQILDLIQEGNMAIVRAIDNKSFNPEFKQPVVTYLGYWIKGKLLSHIMKQTKADSRRSDRNLFFKKGRILDMRDEQDELKKKAMRESILVDAKVTEKQLDEYVELISFIDLPHVFNNSSGEKFDLIDSLEDKNSTEITDQVNTKQKIRKIKRIIKSFPEKQRYIFREKLKGRPGSDIGRELNVSRQYIDQVHHQAANKLIEKMKRYN